MKKKDKIKKDKIKKTKNTVFSKIMIKAAMYIIGVAILIIVCKSTYEFGMEIYKEEGMDPKGKGHDVVVTIPVDASTGEIASILKENGLIESELTFRVQTILYEAEIYSGTYTLSTELCPEELIDAMRPVKKE